MSKLKFDSRPVAPLATNCYFIWNEDTKETLIVDPGNCNTSILEWTYEKGLKPIAILLTHGHFDHIMGITVWQKECPGIPVYAGEKEVEFLLDPDQNMTSRFREYAISVHTDHALADEEEFSLIGAKIRFIHTPGHTRGGGCYYFSEEDWLFSGDTLFKESMGRYDFPEGSYEDIRKSLKRLAAFPENTRVFPGHGDNTTIGWELKNNLYMA